MNSMTIARRRTTNAKLGYCQRVRRRFQRDPLSRPTAYPIREASLLERLRRCSAPLRIRRSSNVLLLRLVTGSRYA